MGAEAQREGIYEMAEDEQWIKSEWLQLFSAPFSPSNVFLGLNSISGINKVLEGTLAEISLLFPLTNLLWMFLLIF